MNQREAMTTVAPSPSDGHATQWEWRRHPGSSDAASHYAREFRVNDLTAQVLMNRGLNSLEPIRQFLGPSLEQLHDPFLMKGMDAAVRRVRRAILRRERIHIHGDYDVDGISATAVLLLGLRAAKADVHYHIINRNDASVGLSVMSLQRDHLPHSPKVIITADCGTSSQAGIEEAARHGIDVIVVDHHMPGNHVPRCAALLNPMQQRCDFPFRHLAAVGVAFNFVYALHLFLQREDASWPALPLKQLTDLVALGTISDLVPLSDENRIFVREGLPLLRSARRPGICALMRAARLLSGTDADGEGLTPRVIGFRLAPLLNAAGRMDDANKCVELLTTDSYRVADSIVAELVEANLQRQACERDALNEAVQRAERLVSAGAPLIVLADRDWHPGVLGIVASRLVERYHLPAIVTAIDSHGMAKGSVRAPEHYDMLDALSQCRDLLDTYGGHKVAAGIAFEHKEFDELLRRLYVAVRSQQPDGRPPARRLMIDAMILLDDLTEDVGRELEDLGPFGAGNPEPVFEARRVHVVHARTLHGGNSRLRLRQGNRVFEAFAYGLRGRIDFGRRPMDVAFSLRMNRSGENGGVELVIRDLVYSQ
jgi:single-stranded-DNA-specific exonuclease